VFGNKVTKYD